MMLVMTRDKTLIQMTRNDKKFENHECLYNIIFKTGTLDKSKQPSENEN